MSRPFTDGAEADDNLLFASCVWPTFHLQHGAFCSSTKERASPISEEMPKAESAKRPSTAAQGDAAAKCIIQGTGKVVSAELGGPAPTLHSEDSHGHMPHMIHSESSHYGTLGENSEEVVGNGMSANKHENVHAAAGEAHSLKGNSLHFPQGTFFEGGAQSAALHTDAGVVDAFLSPRVGLIVGGAVAAWWACELGIKAVSRLRQSR